ncbi:MAG: 16S rRNA (cytosine(1402)-N(4))-methyltransferase [SAR324 cluster bacterium]|uniref:Ribosomal RNA small subunit methyltransferase H n=1 Tax=SAR324 cluster bacterium TaxID=2024889 RepID=A0A2A4T9X7_9DELT|nr:MAG: 16S rRNA (cytosine(1402)-N(4))-methyltransferase [SAR324 cluster bacterium]
MNFEHISVLLDEVLEYCPENAESMIDCTLGGAGHSKALLQQVPGLYLHGVDRDEQALAAADKTLADFSGRYTLHHYSFAEGVRRLREQGVKVDYILADLGVSSHQIDQEDRGFSFRSDAPLDMRMNQQDDFSAADLVNETDEWELTRIIRVYGEETFAKRIARQIVKQRQEKPIETTWQLADCIRAAIPKKFQFGRLHPATKTFQALRIAVNHELEELDQLLENAIELLNFGGRLAIISFHSLEDRPVKKQFKKWADPCECSKNIPHCICGLKPKVKLLHSKIIKATPEEIERNPRSRSAKLRVIEKI